MYPWVNLTRVTLWTPPVEPRSHRCYILASAVPTQPHNMKACFVDTHYCFFHVPLAHLSVVFIPCTVAALIYPEN